MQELIPIIKDPKKGQLVDARLLQQRLENKRDFSNYIQQRIKECFLIENQDYVTLNKIVERGKRKEYYLTIEAAKNLAMMERNEVGNIFRKYFIECEKQLLKQQKPRLPKFLDRYILNSNKIPLGYFSVINATFTTVYREMERVGYVLPDKGITGKDLMPDISIGRTFSDWLKNNGHADFTKNVRYYKHEFVGRPACDARMYPDTCYHLFTYFLKTVWIPSKAQSYFKTKNPEALNYLPKLIER